MANAADVPSQSDRDDRAPSTTEAPRKTPRGPLGRLLDLFSSVRLGVSLLTLLFVYATIGSAGLLYPVGVNILDLSNWRHTMPRQWSAFELTEFEWFHTLPFVALCAALTANIVTTTLRRIPFTVVNLGVWMIHTGIVMLTGASVVYFATKYEGDTVVFMPDAEHAWAEPASPPMIQPYLWLKDSSAIAARLVEPDGRVGPWRDAPIPRMPRYNDYAAGARVDGESRDAASALGRGLDIRVPTPGDEPWPLSGIGVRVTGFLRYAQLRDELDPGGDAYNPFIDVLVTPPGGGASIVERLVALDDERSSALGGSVGLVAVRSADDFAELGQRRSLPGLLTYVLGPPEIGLHRISRDAEGELVLAPVEMNEPLTLPAGTTMTVVQAARFATQARRPVIIPERRRDRDLDVGRYLALARIELSADAWTVERWLPFQRYTIDGLSALPGGLGLHRPARVTLPSGEAVDVAFTRLRRSLPDPVQLDDFILTSHIGGFTGESSSIRDWTSVIRFQTDAGGTTEPRTVSTNNPVDHRGAWFFQSFWDPPREATANTPASSGLAFTGLGVGNREGVRTQLAGGALAVAGMLYAFYVKPIIKARRRAAVLASMDRAGDPKTREGES